MATSPGIEVASQFAIANHYGRADLGDLILNALKAVDIDIDRLTSDDLVPLDQHHTRGLTATIELAGLAAIQARDRVLDLGSGIGGPARYLAKTFGCRVVGVDLTPEFCRVAAMLTERTGLTNKIQFHQGDALSLGFSEETFDVVWSQNVAMNIADRDRLYSEICRVLEQGGRYVFADVVTGHGGPPHFPVPWASDPSCSHLLTADETYAKLQAAGFHIVAFEDQTADAFAHQTSRTHDADSPTTLGVHIVLGPDGLSMLKNSVRNFEEGRTRLVQGLAVRKR